MEKEIQIFSMPETDYEPIIDYKTWRVAVLKYCPNTRPENIKTMQKHDFTDEVFVLLSGNCILYSAGNGECPGQLQAIHLEPDRVYNIPSGYWHNHTLDEGAAVLIVENQDTCDDNSPILPISEEQKAELFRLYNENH